MKKSSTARDAPDLDAEAGAPINAAARATLRGALRDRWGDAIDVDGATGASAAWLVCELPRGRRVFEVAVFSRGDDGDDAMDRAVDYLDGLLAEMADVGEDATLPLDFEGRAWAGAIVFVRGELRDHAAESEAARLLGEPAPLRRVRH